MSKHYLALDVGRRHTGVSFADARVSVALPLATIHHKDAEEMIEAVKKLVTDRDVGTLVIGLPYLMGGEEGEEAQHVRAVTELLKEACPSVLIEFLDERETSKIYHAEGSKDRHAQAATTILMMFLSRRETKEKSS